MTPPLFSLAFAVVSGFWLMYLQMRVIMIRRGQRIAYGDGDNKELRAWIRSHANAFENLLPFGLLALCYELVFGGGWVLLAFMVAMMIGRVLHPAGMLNPRERLIFRVNGMALSLAVQALFLAWAGVRVAGKLVTG